MLIFFKEVREIYKRLLFGACIFLVFSSFSYVTVFVFLYFFSGSMDVSVEDAQLVNLNTECFENDTPEEDCVLKINDLKKEIEIAKLDLALASECLRGSYKAGSTRSFQRRYEELFLKCNDLKRRYYSVEFGAKTTDVFVYHELSNKILYILKSKYIEQLEWKICYRKKKYSEPDSIYIYLSISSSLEPAFYKTAFLETGKHRVSLKMTQYVKERSQNEVNTYYIIFRGDYLKPKNNLNLENAKLVLLSSAGPVEVQVGVK